MNALRKRGRALALLAWATLTLVGFAPAEAQGILAAEPTYRYAGRYEGEWVAERLQLARAAGESVAVAAGRPASRLQGSLGLDVDCAGNVSGHARGQTAPGPSFELTLAAAAGIGLVRGGVDLVSEQELRGTLSDRALSVRSGRVDAALDATLVLPQVEPDTVSLPSALARFHAGEPASSRWALLRGAPGALEGVWEGVLDLSLVGDATLPSLAVSSAGRWSVRRVALAICPWRGEATVRGSLPPAQLQEETVEFTFWPAGDGRLTGEGRGRATLSGGAAGGCQYSGGGPFALRVSGQQRDGRFVVRFEDDDQHPLALHTACPSGRSVLPHPVMLPLFGALELPEGGSVTVNGASPRPDRPGQPTVQAIVEVRVLVPVGALPP